MTCKLQYLERKPHQPWHWFSCGFSILVELEFRVLVFEMGGKLENLEKTLGARQGQTTNSTHT